MENRDRDLKGNRCATVTLMLQRYGVKKDLHVAHTITVSRMEHETCK